MPVFPRHQSAREPRSALRRLVPWLFLVGLVAACDRACIGCTEAKGVVLGHARGPSASPAPLARVFVPRASGPMKLDGELDENNWREGGRTGPFLDQRREVARPYSEARLLYDDDNLYLGLYAADENITAKVTEHDGAVWLDDAFSIRIRPEEMASTYQVDVSAAGVVADGVEGPNHAVDRRWDSGVKFGIDMDGTLNAPEDDDEEWVVEVAVPFSALGVRPVAGAQLRMQLSRCDTPKDGQRRCGAWGDGGGGGAPAALLELR